MEEMQQKINKCMYCSLGTVITVNKFINEKKKIIGSSIELIRDKTFLEIKMDKYDLECLNKIIKSLESIKKELKESEE